MTISSINSNPYLYLQEAQDICFQTMLNDKDALTGNFGAVDHSGGVNPADESESSNESNGVGSTGGVQGPAATGKAPPTNPLNNTMAAYGLLAYIALLAQNDINSKTTANASLIQAALAQLQTLEGSNPALDPTCLANVQAALGFFQQTPITNAEESSYMTFWNNPAVPPPGTKPVSGTPYSPLWDAFYWMGQVNYNANDMGSIPDPNLVFDMAMLFISVAASNQSALGDEGLLSNLLGANGGAGSFWMQNFILDYANQNNIQFSTILAILPASTDPTNPADNYNAFLTSIAAADKS